MITQVIETQLVLQNIWFQRYDTVRLLKWAYTYGEKRELTIISDVINNVLKFQNNLPLITREAKWKYCKHDNVPTERRVSALACILCCVHYHNK